MALVATAATEEEAAATVQDVRSFRTLRPWLRVTEALVGLEPLAAMAAAGSQSSITAREGLVWHYLFFIRSIRQLR